MLEIEDREGIALVRLVHGPVNAMDTELCSEVADALDGLGDARAVVLTGNGRGFSAGVDLRRVVSDGPAYTRGFLPALSRMFVAAFRCPRPLVAAVDGHAIAGGAVLAMAADRRVVASGRPRLGLTELAVGVPFPTAAIEISRHVLGPRLGRVVLGADLLDPAEALRLGMVDEVVEPEAVLERASELAEALGSVPRETFAHTRAQLRGDAWARIASPPEGHAAAVERIWTSGEGLAAIEAFVARTLASA